MKKAKWQTVAAFMMGMASVLSPTTQAAPTVAAQSHSQNAEASNSKAVIQTKENKGQGITINNSFDGDGGLLFHHEGMFQHSPMYFGRHTKETYRSQQKARKNKFKSQKGRK